MYRFKTSSADEICQLFGIFLTQALFQMVSQIVIYMDQSVSYMYMYVSQGSDKH